MNLPARLLMVCLVCLLFSNAGYADGKQTRRETTPREMLSAETAASIADSLPLDKKISWQIYVPDAYDPAKPAGVIVYISPTSSGRIWRSWKRVFDEQNLIYIAANASGNNVPVKRRIQLAVLAQALVKDEYVIDQNRLYISGFSGGGRSASYTSASFPEIFTGGIYICGAEYVAPEFTKPAFFTNRHVYITGGRDFSRRKVTGAYREMSDEGAGHLLLMDLPGYAHELPTSRHLRRAIAYLDEGLAPVPAE